MSKIKHWTTTNIKEVLNERYCRGANGADYNDIKEELSEHFTSDKGYEIDVTLWYKRGNKIDMSEMMQDENYDDYTILDLCELLEIPKDDRCNYDRLSLLEMARDQ